MTNLLLITLGLHIFADFTMQGWFANGKQKRWWEEQCKKEGVSFEPYQNDYKLCLVLHALYWSLITFSVVLCVTMPHPAVVVLAVLINTVIHTFVDDAKANKMKINLITDQIFHFVQILGTVFVLWIINR